MALRTQAAAGDMATPELGVLMSQCLDRRIGDWKILAHQAFAAQLSGDQGWQEA